MVESLPRREGDVSIGLPGVRARSTMRAEEILLRRVWPPVRLAGVFILAQGLLPNLILIGAMVLAVDVLGLTSLDFHGRTVADLARGEMVAVRLVVQVLALLLTVAAWRLVEQSRLARMRLTARRRQLRPAAWGLLLGAGSAVTVFGAGVAAGAFTIRAGRGPFDSASLWVATGWLAVSCLLAPLLEEVWYRGYVLEVLTGAWGFPAAVAASGMAFGGIHLLNPNASHLGALNIALTGIVLCVGVVVLDSLWFAIAAHAAWNFTQFFLIGLPNSGISAASLGLGRLTLLSTTPRGPVLLSGGAFGIEASLINTAVQLLLVGWLLALLRARGRATEEGGVADPPSVAPLHQ